MLKKKMPDDDDPRNDAKTILPLTSHSEHRGKSTAMAWFKGLIRGKASNSNSLREALEEYIEEIEESGDEISADNHKALITNVLKTHDLTVSDVMIPRANIVAIEMNASFDDLKNLLRQKQYSRVPVYRETLDDVIGTIHIKDILSCMMEGRPCTVSELVRDVSIVSPSMPVMDLLHHMRETKSHMALVVDEFGGIDGLVTINDVIVALVGEIEDEFNHDEQPQIVEKADGSLIADARMDIEEFEDRYGEILTEEEREDVDTLGGLAFSIAGRVPARGEVLNHDSGMVLEVIDADPRRVKSLRIRNLPARKDGDDV